MTAGDGLFPPDAYARDDESPDREFYGVPRKVVHIEGADRSGGGGDPLHAVWARK